MTGQVTVNLHFCAEIPVTEVADSWQNMKSEIENFFCFEMESSGADVINKI